MKFFMALVLLANAAGAQSLLVEGNSLFSVNNGESNWTEFFQPLPVHNHAAGGDTISNIVSEYDIQDHPQAGPGVLFILEGGINDIANIPATAAQTYSNALVVLAKAQADGCATMLCTIAPASPLTPAQESERLDYNDAVRAGTNYLLFDVDALISHDTNDLRYYQYDGLHWTGDFQGWLGLVVVPDLLGFEPHPLLSISVESGSATLAWPGVAWATNALQRSGSVFGPWTNVNETAIGQTQPLSVQTAAEGDAAYFRIQVQHFDFPTFYEVVHVGE